jgi:hypothetical protein
MEKEPSPEKKSTMDKSLGQMRAGYQSVDEKLRLKKGDSLPLLIGKVLLRIFLIVAFILLSPFILVGLILALIAAL